MNKVSQSPLPVVTLIDRAIEAVARIDMEALTEVLADCPHAEVPDSADEFSRTLARQAAFEKVLEQTGRNIRMLRNEESSFRFGRSIGHRS
jgi:hypothetical protein